VTFSLRFSTSLLCTLALLSISAYGDEAPAEIDKARVFPVQKNPIVEHSQQADKPSDADPKKPNPKDTTLRVDGNGGSTNRSAGGKAILKQRIPFD
jgi:hypothetical protein